jgi:hypothetical protein
MSSFWRLQLWSQYAVAHGRRSACNAHVIVSPRPKASGRSYSGRSAHVHHRNLSILNVEGGGDKGSRMVTSGESVTQRLIVRRIQIGGEIG